MARSAEQFFELYATASTYLKEKFPHLKIGGNGSCGFYGVTGGNVPTYAATSPRFDYFRTFFDDFLAYVKAHIKMGVWSYTIIVEPAMASEMRMEYKFFYQVRKKQLVSGRFYDTIVGRLITRGQE